MRGRFSHITLLIMGPLLAWLACFAAAYALGALACARGFAEVRVAGLGITTVLTVLLVLATAAATVRKILAARRRMQDVGQQERFGAFLAFSLGALVLMGLLLLWLPALVVRPVCTGQPELEVGASGRAAAGTMPAFPAGL
ncbi:MAG TPA: hypothetical protein VNQ32_09625 [Steroidobacteraceae bacterium]|nr:hypothetical protein [Steroidobacteraceae bacterium]